MCKECFGLGQLPSGKVGSQATVAPVSPEKKAFAQSVAVGPTVGGPAAPALKATRPTKI
jgi:hypothetical protein